MPIYEFRCKTCKNEFEAIRPMSATDEPPCPDCGSEQVSRRLSLFFSGAAGAPKANGGGGSGCGGGGCGCH